ncbi:MAG: hypothetical protein HYV77_04400 [Candidatus Wildermuthbacteria bacterium]|nr:hypothetical protein [Candidatus Wildermuthbacteria bacterium]
MEGNFEDQKEGDETSEEKIVRLQGLFAEKRQNAIGKGIESTGVFMQKIADFARRFQTTVQAENQESIALDYSLYNMIVGATGGNPSKVDFEGMVERFIEEEL